MSTRGLRPGSQVVAAIVGPGISVTTLGDRYRCGLKWLCEPNNTVSHAILVKACEGVVQTELWGRKAPQVCVCMHMCACVRMCVHVCAVSFCVACDAGPRGLGRA